MWSRGRPQSQPTVGPPGYNISMQGQGFNQYPRNHPQGTGSYFQESQNANTRRKRDRARPHYQYSYYRDDSLNSNNSRFFRGGYSNMRGVGRGSGAGTPDSASSARTASTSHFNNNRQNGYNRVTNNAYAKKEEVINRSDRNNAPDTNCDQTKENRNNSNVRRSFHEDVIQPSMYFCPKCGESYYFRNVQNKYAGKIPLILQCNHTMCQECAYQGLKNYKVNCPTCLADSTLTQDQTPVCPSDLQNVFLPNFYLVGVMYYHKSSGNYLKNLDNMTFVSTGTKKMHHSVLPSPSDRCCFGTCPKEATMFCPSCEGIYCFDCCTVVHKSTKILMTHEPVVRRKSAFSLMLENCGEHPTMQVEFFCKTCDLAACCYCVLDMHADHDRVPLYHLNDSEMEEFKRLKKIAEKTLKEVLSAQKKTTKLANFETVTVKKEVCHYFADCHAKLESLEKKLCDELENFKTSNRGLDGIQASLMASAEQLKQLVAFNIDKVGDQKLNLRGALDKLKNIDSIPRFILNENGQTEPLRFVASSEALSNLEEDIAIEKSSDTDYRLVTENELPQDYIIDVDESDSEVENVISAILDKSDENIEGMGAVPKKTLLSSTVPASASSSVRSKRMQKYSLSKESYKKKLDMERVNVQHINSMVSFFVQYGKDQSKLGQLNKDVENYVKMGGAETVQQPQLGELYLALYVNESGKSPKEQKWCRARLTEIKKDGRGPAYEMFFIDFGKTQILDGNRIRDIPAFLTQKKPFAIECMLYNPMNVIWNKNAHVSLAKILLGKDVYMMEKAYSSGIHEVELMIASSDGGITSVTDILVHAHNSVEQMTDDTNSLDGSVCVKKDGYCPMLRVYPNTKTFAKNQKEKVTIATVVDPHNIFVHLEQHQEAFKAMNHAIKKAYRNARTTGCVPVEGSYVLVEYKDPVRSSWHRAFVKSVDLNRDSVHVLLVDWGLNVVVSSEKIKSLEESFTRLYSQAVLVKLAHIAPYNKQAVWSTHASAFLQTYHKSQDVLKMIVQDAEPELEVALFDISGNVDICLNALMVENNLADSTGPISTKVEWPQFDVINPEFSEEDGLMSSLLKKVDEQVDPDSDEEDLSDVKKRQVYVVKVEAPDLLYVKFFESKERESKMFKELQIHYSESQETKPSWEVGEMCVTEIGHEYARGRISDINGEEYKIYLVDKVIDITAPKEKVYVYDKYFAKYPQAVIKSHLANIRPAGDTGKWSISSIEALQQIFTKQKRLYANKAAESDTDMSKKSLPLDMWYGIVIKGGPLDPDRMRYTSINNALVKLGFAYKVARPVSPKPSTSQDTQSVSPLVKKATTGEELLKSLNKTSSSTSSDLEQVDAKEEQEDGTEVKKSLTDNKTKGKVILPKKAGNSHKKSKSKDKELDKVLVEEKTTRQEKKMVEVPSELEGDEKNKEDVLNWNRIVEEELGKVDAQLDNLDLDADNKSTVDSGSEDSPYRKHEVVIDDWMPPLRLTQNDFQGRVTCVETGGYLYLHEQAMDDVYYKMEANIKEYFDHNPPEVSGHQWQPGQLCTIKFTDEKWYRGRVLKVKSPEEVSVFMIDFGSDHLLSPDVLFREILYTDVGSFATRVKLDKVYSKLGTWLTSDYDRFQDLVTEWCRIVVKGPLDVELPLVDVYNNHGVYVNQKLIDVCPNLSRCYSFPISCEDEEDDTVVIESIENVESYAEEVIQMLMDNFNKELDISRPILPVDFTAALQYKCLPLPGELLEGKKMLMEIGGIIDFNKVTLCLPGTEVNEDMYNLIVDLQDAVALLPHATEFTVGMPCLAPFSEDDIWYRAQITSTKAVESGLVDVIFVDYGNSETVATTNIKAIIPEYLTVPQQIWEATVNIALEEDANAVAVIQLMNSLDRKKRLVKLIKENPLTVDLYDKNEKLCYEALISNGTLKLLQQNETSD